MIVNSNRQCFFGLILSDHIIIQECLDLLRFQKIDLLIHRRCYNSSSTFFFQDFVADLDTVITDINPIRSCDQLAHLIF